MISKDDQLNIYKYYIGGDITVGTACISPIPPEVRGKQDKNESFSIYETKSGNYRWKDWGSSDLSGGAVDLIQTIEKIDKDDYRSAMEFYENVIQDTNTSHIKVNKHRKAEERKPIVYFSKQFKRSESRYMGSYGLTAGELLRRDIYACRGVDWGGGKIVFKSTPTFPKFVYKLKDESINNSFKLYNPLSKERRLKWKCHNVSDVILEGYHTLPPRGNTLIITSSTKDSLCLEKIKGIYSRSPTSESNFNTLINNSAELNQRFRNIYIIFDNDDTGIKNSSRLSELTGWSILDFPFPQGGKDISDTAKLKGYAYIKRNLLRSINRLQIKKI